MIGYVLYALRSFVLFSMFDVRDTGMTSTVPHALLLCVNAHPP